jgi:hypothetical protein
MYDGWLEENQNKIDAAIVGWINKQVAITDPTSDTSVRGILVAYDGGRALIKRADSNVVDGHEVVYLLNGAMSISLLEKEVAEKPCAGSIIKLHKEMENLDPVFTQVVDEEFWDITDDPWHEDNLKGD